MRLETPANSSLTDSRGTPTLSIVLIALIQSIATLLGSSRYLFLLVSVVALETLSMQDLLLQETRLVRMRGEQTDLSTDPAATSTAKSPDSALIAGIVAGFVSAAILVLIICVIWRTRKRVYVPPQPEKITPVRGASQVSIQSGFPVTAPKLNGDTKVELDESKASSRSRIQIQETAYDAEPYLPHSIPGSRAGSSTSSPSPISASTSADNTSVHDNSNSNPNKPARKGHNGRYGRGLRSASSSTSGSIVSQSVVAKTEPVP